ncbi:5'-nucleotidase C-terminal domain-containing protein, partial [Aeromicrobium sp.]|uniref:5'-nucleotidase C-terminal domain-containing protein n=1 Tax=Aeromicrobium sp. TaxID=1871063 RepID=UPI0025C3D4F9
MSRRLAAVITAALLGGPLLAVAPAHAADDVTLNLIGINDFHGRIDANTVKFAGTVEQLRQDGGDANSLLISAGDNVSASLFASAAQGDIPTIDVLNALDLDASAAGNHELDKGADDLTGRLSDAADFPFLSANIFKADSSPLLEKYKIFTVAGVDVAVVGAVTEETSSLVSPGGIQGLTFTDPTEAINDTVDELDALADPPDVIVASIHEGAPDGAKTYQQNIDNSPVFKEIMENTDPKVDAIFMGHTHQAYAYDAPIPGEPIKTRPVLQTGNYGGNVGQIELTFDKASGTVTSYTKKNQARTIAADSVLTSTFPRVAAVKPIVDDALAFAAVKGNEPIGEQTADITTAFNAGGRDDRASESTLGNLVADALLSKISDSPSGADIGVVNPGGLRADLLYAGTSDTNGDGVITFAEASSVLPFFNNLSTVSLTGASFRKVLEQQWQRTADNTIPSRSYLQLGLSKNVRYTFDPARPEGSRITSISINGHPYDPAAEYKVGTFAFLGTGGDNFRAFTEGTSVDSGLVDYQAFVDYLSDNGPVSPDYARRSVQVNGVKSAYGSGASVTFSLPKLDLTSLGSQKNTSVSARLLYGAGQSRRLGSKGVTAGASAPFTFQLPAGEVGSMNIETTAFPTGTKASIPLLVKKAATVTAASTGAVFGDDATVDVTVTGSGGSSSGTVTLSKGATQLGQKTLSGADTASFTVDTEGLGAGANELTIAYSGDADFGPGSGTTTLTVAKASTSVQADDPAAAPVAGTFVVGAGVASAPPAAPAPPRAGTAGGGPRA